MTPWELSYGDSWQKQSAWIAEQALNKPVFLRLTSEPGAGRGKDRGELPGCQHVRGRIFGRRAVG